MTLIIVALVDFGLFQDAPSYFLLLLVHYQNIRRAPWVAGHMK